MTTAFVTVVGVAAVGDPVDVTPRTAEHLKANGWTAPVEDPPVIPSTKRCWSGASYKDHGKLNAVFGSRCRLAKDHTGPHDWPKVNDIEESS